jgi:phosphoribosylanthranilate isomerase
MRVKICGITSLEDALLCQNYGADALGFIFYQKSPRYITPLDVAEISEKLSVFLTKVGVFVNESPDFINTIAERARLTAVQLHGEEPPEILDQIDKPVIKTFRVKHGFDFSTLSQFEKYTLLLDTYSDREYGGTGSAFDWDIIPKDLRSKIILAGGISSENIEEVYKEISPAAVDLASSLESFPGKKDPFKVKKFFSKIQRLRQIT